MDVGGGRSSGPRCPTLLQPSPPCSPSHAMANRGSLVIIFILFLIFYSDLSPPTDITDTFSHAKLIARERASLAVLNASRYQDFDPPNKRWVNLTGLKEEYGYGWDRLETVKGRWEEHATASLGEDVKQAINGKKDEAFPIYHNVTGLVRGRWVRSKLEIGLIAPQVNLSAIVPPETYATNEWTRNISGSEGKMKIEFGERDRGNSKANVIRDKNGNEVARAIRAHLRIQDQKSWGDGWDIKLYGVHFVQIGAVLVTTTSEK